MPDPDTLRTIISDRLTDQGIAHHRTPYGVYLEAPQVDEGLLLVTVAASGWVQVTRFPDDTHGTHESREWDNLRVVDLDDLMQLVESYLPAGWWLTLPAHTHADGTS